MFWLLRFRGETLGATLTLWINAITWQIHKLIYKIFHPKASKQDFIRHIISEKPQFHWSIFPIDIQKNHYYDKKLKVWLDTVGIIWVYFTHPSEHPSEWLDTLCEGQIGFDIGAHRGYWSILYQNRVLPDGLIFAWEPYPPNYQNLLQNIARNSISHIIPLRLAAWRECALLSFERTSDLEIQSFLVQTQESQKGNILATSVDNIVESLSLPRLDWIKMDIEGAEVEALRGAMKTLSRYKPTLWIEFHDTLDALKALLAEANYEIRGEAHYGPTPYHRDPGYLWAVPRASTS